MSAGPVFTSRLSGRQILDSEDVAFGRIRDVVILPTASGEPPWVLGLVVTLQRRQIFVNLGRVAEISLDGVHLRGGTVDLRRFSPRTGEILASELYGQRAGAGVVLDVGIAESERRRGGWEVTVLAVSQGRALGLGLRHNNATIVPWDSCPELFKAGALAEQLVQLREMNPTDLATAVERMSATRRRQLVEALQDEELYVCEPPSITPTGRYLGTGSVSRRWPGAWPPTTSSAWPSPTMTVTCSARSPSTTSWTVSCPQAGEKVKSHEDAAAARPLPRRPRRPERPPRRRAAHGRPVRR
jgi:hypothetical protein